MKTIALVFSSLTIIATSYSQTNLWQNAGNIGIGTTNPSAKLEVNGGSIAVKSVTSTYGSIALNPGGTGYAGYIDWYRDGQTRLAYMGFQDFGGSQNNLGLNLENGASFVIGGGNVGIGTASPGVKLGVNGTVAFGKNYQNVLLVGPLDNAPGYFYINTKIPFIDSPAPQLHITGYNYSAQNKAVSLTLSWYVYQNAFYWTQYKSDIGYYNPSRIRLGTYDDNGTTRIRIEIANDGTYWSSYAISATDHNGVATNYSGWNYSEGVMPDATGNMLTVQENAGFVFKASGNVGIGTTNPGSTVQVHQPANSELAITFNSSGYAKMFVGYDSTGGGGIRQGLEIYRNYGDATLYFNATQPGSNVVYTANIGNVGIGTTSPTEKLSVNGKIRAKEVIVETNWSDYVFAKDYKLAPLSEVEHHIEQQGHLPGVPSAQEVAAKGVSVGDMQAILLAKIEELTLHVIQQGKRMDAQQSEIATLKAENIQLKAQIK